jgi:hypothetical protein
MELNKKTFKHILRIRILDILFLFGYKPKKNYFSKKARLLMYKDYVKAYDEDDTDMGLGICHFLKHHRLYNCVEIDLFDKKKKYIPFIIYFPELLKRKPKKVDIEAFWWRCCDYQIRYETVKECINEILN